MKNNQVDFDNTAVWRDFTAKDFEKALETSCSVKYPRKHYIQFGKYMVCANSYEEAVKDWAKLVYKHINNLEHDRNN
mgnify:CR=1 FL=1